MLFLCIDVETSSIKPENGELLSFAAVLEDTNNIRPVEELPFFYCVFRHDFIKGEPYALNMNKGLIQEISEGESENLIDLYEFNQLFNDFLFSSKVECHGGYDILAQMIKVDKNGNSTPVLHRSPKEKIKLKASGKNFGTFDKGWIESKIPNFNTYFQFNHRVLDVGSLMVDFKNDEWLPGLLECKKRAGIKGEVTHNALEDCWDVIEILRTKYER